jgi:hypothetical protein
MDSLSAAKWVQIVSVFLSALLAMIVGILLDLFKRHRDKVKVGHEKQALEVQQINVVISGIVFNIELLLHVASQNILPHYKDSQAVYKQIRNNRGNEERIFQIMTTLHKYPSLFKTCPEMYLIECDFSKELPFIIERDAELVKHSGWLVTGVREIKDATARRNRNIEGEMNFTSHREGEQNLDSFQSVIQMQASIANTECVVVSQLFEVSIKSARSLEKMNNDYKIPVRKSKFTLPEELQKRLMAVFPVRSAFCS